MRKLFDAKYGHEVAQSSDDEIVSRWGHRFQIQGCAVLDSDDEMVGTMIDGRFFNSAGVLMAVETFVP